MSPVMQKAKLEALNGAKDFAESELRKSLGGLKKVTVASDSKEGLKEGLEKAEEIVEGEEKDCSECPGCPHCMGEEESEDMEQEDSRSEDMEDQQESSEPMDIDELEAKIQELMKMKAKLQK